MTIESTKIPAYVKRKNDILDFIDWLDFNLEIEDYVTVVFRSFTKNTEWGWCQPNENTGNIDVVINTAHAITHEDQIETLAHEFVHVNQHDKDYFISQEFESPDYDYETDPNEIEAWSKMGDIVAEFYK